MKRIFFLCLLAASVLVACQTAAPQATNTPALFSPAPASPLPPQATNTPAFFPPTPAHTLTPAEPPLPYPPPLLATLTRTPPPAPAPTQPDEQCYTDPEGWFSIALPAAWEAGETPGAFSGEDGFVEIGYLPDLGFMRGKLNVAMWQANIAEAEPERTTIDLGANLTIDLDTETRNAVILENPAAGYEYRFVLLQADAAHFPRIQSSFRWLRPLGELPRGARPAFHQMTLRPQDAALWENAAPMPEGITYGEYPLNEEGQHTPPGERGFINFAPPDVVARWRQMLESNPYEHVETEDRLAAFGYQLVEVRGKPSMLYKDGELLFDNVYKVDRAAVFPTESGELLVFAVTTFTRTEAGPEFRAYVVQGDRITERRLLYNDLPYPPIMVNGDLLWVRVDGTHVLVENSEQRVIFDFSTYFGARVPLRSFKSWNDHWILEVSDFIIQDGEILNEKYNFQETFAWRLIDDKPFFFFRKGKRVGISYDGQIWPLYYHDVLRGYCCGLTVNNPIGRGNRLYFFAQRDGVWYYVELIFE